MDPFYYYLDIHSEISTTLDVYSSSFGVFTDSALYYPKMLLTWSKTLIQHHFNAILISRLISAHAQTLNKLDAQFSIL